MGAPVGKVDKMVAAVQTPFSVPAPSSLREPLQLSPSENTVDRDHLKPQDRGDASVAWSLVCDPIFKSPEFCGPQVPRWGKGEICCLRGWPCRINEGKAGGTEGKVLALQT